jgi:hypothetical protein
MSEVPQPVPVVSWLGQADLAIAQHSVSVSFSLPPFQGKKHTWTGVCSPGSRGLLESMTAKACDHTFHSTSNPSWITDGWRRECTGVNATVTRRLRILSQVV